MLQGETTSSATNASQGGVRSGGALPAFYLGLADKYGQIVGISNGDKVSVAIDDSLIPKN